VRDFIYFPNYSVEKINNVILLGVHLQKDFKLKPIGIILKQHGIKELREIYHQLNEEYPRKEVTHLELVHSISLQLDIHELLNTWPDRAFAYNTSFKFYKVSNLLSKTPIKDGSKIIKSFFTDETWRKVTDRGYSPQEIPEKGHLLQVAQHEKKFFFLFASAGRTKEVFEDLTIRNLVQPQFNVAHWKDDSRVLQVRGVDSKGISAEKFKEYLYVKDKIDPQFDQIMVDDRDKVKRLATLLGGRARRGKFIHDEEEIAEATYVAQADTDLYATGKVKTAMREGYNQDSAGIDFIFDSESYTVWVGFKTGSLWLRSGIVNEAVIDFIESKIVQV
jgi:hypothetical protein